MRDRGIYLTLAQAAYVTPLLQGALFEFEKMPRILGK